MEYNVFVDLGNICVAIFGLISGAFFVSEIKEELALNADGLKKDIKRDMTELKEERNLIKNKLTELQMKTEA